MDTSLSRRPGSQSRGTLRNAAALAVAIVAAGLASPAAAADADEMPPPKSPREGLESLRVGPGLRVELVAAEPLVVDPVAIDFAADGRLWVCEMRDYPSGIDGKGKPGGRIVVLDDADGDGRHDRSTVFLDGLPFPTGVMAWRKGVLVCAAPEILYAEDTDGDGRADLRRVLFRGFATENYQARVNGLSYGLDNWVYGANGLIGGTIRGQTNAKEVVLGSRDFRIMPDTGALEPASGLTQQGRVRDDRGNQFGGNNSVLIQHYPLPDHYARRNLAAAAPAPAVHVPRDPDSNRVYPASRTLERFNNPASANHVTSACSPLVHRDPYLGDAYYGNAFVCEPVHNLVHREVLSPDGVTFAGHRAGEEKASEFLSSTDNWFRPVQVRTGPDGALYVVDMYRFVIEHPRWISPDRLAHLDVRAGDDRGRIYRVVREDRPPRPVPALDRLDTPALAAALDSPNGTLRDTVQRLLVHRGDPAAAPVLDGLARTSPRAVCRLQALCALDGLHALTPEQVRRALSDPDPGVRAQSVRLAEPLLGPDPSMGPALLALVRDPAIAVRYQLALSLGEWDDPRAGEALGRLAVADGSDRWLRAATLSSAGRRPGEVLAAVLAADLDPSARSALLEPLVATVAASGTPEELEGVLDSCVAPEAGGKAIPAWRLAALATLLDAGERSGRPAGTLKSKPDRLRPAFDAARGLARDDRARSAERVAAVRLLGREERSRDDDVALLGDLLGPRSPSEVQSAALRALARLRDDRSAERLLSQWPGLGPALRGAALDALLARPEWTAALLAAMERGTVRTGEVDAAHRQALRNLGDAALRGRAARLLAAVDGGRGRAEVVAAYREARSRPGDPARGAAAFGRVCAGCHRVAGKGHAVGPDLEALTDTTPEALSIAILDPNRDVDARYLNYNAALADGRVVAGLLASETGNAVTLKRQEDQADVILRSDLEELRSTGQSLMPEGLERDLSPADLADLIAFLDAPGRPKSVAGNRPETVVPAADGSVRLSAATAALFGDTLTFETQFGNLGYWNSPNDRASWTFHTDRPATYTLSLDWACADESAGNAYQIRIDDTLVRGVVGGTGSWSNYRSLFVREVKLPPGTHRLEMRPDGPARGALIDLRSITLTPR